MENELLKWFEIPKQITRKAENDLSLYQALIASGNKKFDIKKLLNTPLGEQLIKQLEPFLFNKNPMDRGVVEYWEKLGLKKEFIHGGPQEWNDWTIFTPLSAEKSKSKKYPLLFFLHGGSAGPDDGTLMFFEESTGPALLAAKHELILVLLDDHSDDGILRLYNYMKENYPVDLDRVYLSGFSAGGQRSTQTGLMHPELFSGILVGAGLPVSFDYKEEYIKNAEQYELAVIGIGGSAERGNMIPYCKTNEAEGFLPDFVKAVFLAENKIRWINGFLRLNHIKTYRLDEHLKYWEETPDLVGKLLGFKTDYTEVQKLLGVDHYISECRDDNNLCKVKFIIIDNVPHIQSPNMMELGWEFLSKFSRDPVTRKLICSEN